MEEKITQDDLIQPFEAGAPLMVTIVCCKGLAKADTFGKSDPMCILEFNGADVAETGEYLSTPLQYVIRAHPHLLPPSPTPPQDVCDNTMDPVWYPEKKHTFKLKLPSRSKLPLLKVKVFDSDAPAILSKVASASKTGDFLGEVTLKGLNLLHPDGKEYLDDITPEGLPEEKKVLGKVYKLELDPDKVRRSERSLGCAGTFVCTVSATNSDAAPHIFNTKPHFRPAWRIAGRKVQ